MTRA